MDVVALAGIVLFFLVMLLVFDLDLIISLAISIALYALISGTTISVTPADTSTLDISKAFEKGMKMAVKQDMEQININTFPKGKPEYIDIGIRNSSTASIYRKDTTTIVCVNDESEQCFSNFKFRTHSNGVRYICTYSNEMCYVAK